MRLREHCDGSRAPELAGHSCFQWADDSSQPVVVKDTGAGDAFTAALAMGWLVGKPLEAINRRANQVARYVCSCEGATPLLPDFPDS
jgi:fructokinase